MDSSEGALIESRYRDNLKNWLGAYHWPVEEVAVDELDLLPHAVEAGEVRPGDIARLRELDPIVRGQDRSHPGAGVLLLAVELSQTINVEDIEGADERAETLRRAGYNARGFTGGYRVHPAATEAAATHDVVVDLRRPPALTAG